MKNLILKYGLISGAVGAVMMFCMALYLGNDPGRFSHGEVFGYTGIVLSMLFVFFGVRAYRDQVASGVISFGKAFQVGLMITLISCAIYVATWFVVSNTLMTDFMDKYSEFMIQQLQAGGASAEKIAEKTAEMEQFKEMYKNPLVKIAFTFLEPFPVGLAVTLLSAAILRRS
ncbi:MAG: DUF4199 domain-containing protein [Saprospiraceae bacterium]|jgi:hypothetical protein|nr:DUF4199 domain-containing protein [Saprospiraceae bacterium]